MAALCFLPHDCLLYAFQLDRMAYSTSTLSLQMVSQSLQYIIHFRNSLLPQIAQNQIDSISAGGFEIRIRIRRRIIKETERISDKRSNSARKNTRNFVIRR